MERSVGELVEESAAGSQSRTTEVVATARRRRFSKSYIAAILKELDEAEHGQRGKILRREGLYSKQVSRWREQLQTGVSSERGRPKSSHDELRKQLARQERELVRLRRKLEQAEIIIDVQKKVSALLNINEVEQEKQ